MREHGRVRGRILGLLLFFMAGILPVQSAGVVEVPVGRSHIVEADDIERVAIASGEVAAVEVIEARSEVLIFGRSPGHTDLVIWHGNGQRSVYPIHVHAPGAGTDKATVQHLVSLIDGVTMNAVEDHLILTGTPESPQDAARLQRLLTLYPDIRNFSADFDAPPPKTVRLEARFVELSRSKLEQIGVDWSPRSPAVSFAWASDLRTNNVFRGDFGGFLPADQLPLDIGQANSYLGVGLNLNAMIDLLGESGEARVIAEPMLSTLSGSSAQFQAGGEVPIPIQGDDGATTVSFRDYGILLRVEPAVMADNQIRTRVEVEISDVDESVTVMGIPGFSVRQANTEMRGPSGEAMLIAGLIDGRQSEAVSQVPGLGDLPVIGELFRSRRFQSDETELVVVITPYLQEEAPPAPVSVATPSPAEPTPSGVRETAEIEPFTPDAGHQPLPLELPP
ncbi:hypothetical protein GJ672_03960 [Spiribacter sp. 2438]|uniref:type II and III secretion system protein family protein n=1 Tax=Spiribacter sp. 2438 TaxID=2666185 RepID=UPI0012AFD4EE|nr:pilus assembly protein N-terminal domain-containing protein [Spiribacter sp. 2438]QGM21505.1 hypothetical protein GJ672_03960 [Spiribacter sp. 2438]